MTTDDHGDWGDESAELFRSARRAYRPSATDRERIRTKLGLQLGAAALTLPTASFASGGPSGSLAPAASGGPSAPPAAMSVSVSKKVGVGMFLKMGVGVGACAVALALVVSRADHPTAPSLAQSGTAAATVAGRANALAQPRPGSALASDLAAPPAITTDALPVAPAVRRAAPTAPRAPRSGADEEASMLAEIDRAIRAEETSRARRLLEDHQRRFPTGLLTEEADGARVLVRCLDGDRAGSGASAFLAAHPRSPLRARIASACGGAP